MAGSGLLDGLDSGRGTTAREGRKRIPAIDLRWPIVDYRLQITDYKYLSTD